MRAKLGRWKIRIDVQSKAVCSAVAYSIAKQLCKKRVVVGLHKLGKHFVLVSFELVHIRAVALTVLPFIASLLTGGRLEAAERRVSDCNRDFTTALSDCLAGFSVVKSFKAEKEIFELFARSNRALEKEKFGRERIVTIVGMIGAITAIFAQLGVFIAGAYFALNGYGLTPGAVILFVNLMNFTIEPIASLPGLLAGRKAALGLVDKLARACCIMFPPGLRRARHMP